MWFLINFFQYQMEWNIAESSSHQNNVSFSERNCVQELTCHWKKNFCHRKKIPVTGRNFLTQDKSCCHRKKFAPIAKNFPVAGKHFMSQEAISCHSNKFPVRQSKYFFLWQKLPVKGFVFPLEMHIHPIHLTVFFLSHELFFLWERIVFFMKFGSS